MKRTPICVLALVLLCTPSCRKTPAPPAAASPETAPLTVKGTTVPAGEKMFPRFLRVTGQLAGQTDAVVAADAAGRVISAPVERGSLVRAGDALAKLDDRQPRLTLAEAEASVALAKSRLALARNEQERNKPLAEKRAVAASDYQKFLTEVMVGEAELAAAEARQAQARKTVEDCVIRALTGGVVAERLVDPGEYVKMDSPVARVVDLAVMRLVLNVPETEVGALEMDQAVEFTTAAFPGKSFAGTLRFLGGAMREASRDLVVEAVVENTDGKLRPGFFCDARILLREESAVAVPVDAVRSEGSRRKVFVIRDQRISERLVETGVTRGGFTEIRRGVTAGEAVLVNPAPAAADGARFEPAS